MKLQKFLLFFLLVSIFYSCKTEQKQAILKENSTSIKYAKGFDIQSFDTYKKLIIKSPYPDAKEQFEYIIIPKGKTISKALKDLIIIRTPIEQIVVTSTTHIPMLELLEAENNLVGFPNTQYICSSKTRQLIANGTIKELGKEENINTEVLLDLNPEMLVGFSLNSNNKMFENIEKAGIPVLLNGDWLEETPLGRAEWLKFFGVLFNKEKLADSIFNAIAKDYNEAVLLVKEAKTKPTILSGVQFKDVWNLPAGKSFVAKLFKDANTEYLWAPGFHMCRRRGAGSEKPGALYHNVHPLVVPGDLRRISECKTLDAVTIYLQVVFHRIDFAGKTSIVRIIFKQVRVGLNIKQVIDCNDLQAFRMPL